MRPPFDFGGQPVGKAPEGAPNIVLVTIDSLRADHLGCYGYGRQTSPHIDRLAAEGVVFEQAIASTSWTLPSHMSMFTSLYDWVHGVADTERRLAIRHPLLAEVLQEAGYRTAGFYSGPFLHPAYGFEYGFDDYVNCTFDAGYDERDLESVQGDREAMDRGSELDITGPRIHEAIESWAAERMEEPFFLFVHYWDVHHDYIPPAPHDTAFDPGYEGTLDVLDLEHNDAIHPGMDPRDLEHLVALYDGEIRWTDHWIGKLRGLLEERGVAGRTLVVLTADHGEAFFEHGRKGHRKDLFDETVRVPLVMWGAGVEGGEGDGRRIASQVRTIDIYPTLVEAAGLEAVPRLQGRSLAPLVAGEVDALDLPPAHSELATIPGQETGFHALRTADWKLIVRHGVLDEGDLYDLRSDPGELRPTPASSTETGRAALAAWELEWGTLAFLRAKLEMDSYSAELVLDPALRERLRSLGYIK